MYKNVGLCTSGEVQFDLSDKKMHFGFRIDYMNVTLCRTNDEQT